MKKVLLQMDIDNQPSSFDSIVAIDSDVDHLLRYSNVTVENVEALVHGAMFTRGGKSLANTAIFVGGTNVENAQKLTEKINKTFFGPVRVSVMMDANGCNTTASAAVLCAEKHLDLKSQEIMVLGGTGPVGQRIAHLCALQQANVSIVSRSIDNASAICNQLKQTIGNATLQPVQSGSDEYVSALSRSNAVFSAGAAGVELLNNDDWQHLENCQVVIDLNAVPPVGVHGIDPMDKAETRNGLLCYGAIGVGGFKMKIHRQSIKSLFDTNDAVLDIEQIYAVGKDLAE